MIYQSKKKWIRYLLFLPLLFLFSTTCIKSIISVQNNSSNSIEVITSYRFVSKDQKIKTDKVYKQIRSNSYEFIPSAKKQFNLKKIEDIYIQIISDQDTIFSRLFPHSEELLNNNQFRYGFFLEVDKNEKVQYKYWIDEKE